MALVKRNTAYSLDDIVNTKYGIKLKCTTAGTTDTDPLILNGTSPITDGTVTWEVVEENHVSIGTIISYMGNTVPERFLACDGTIYNITDYQILADHINSEFGSYNHFGGDGTTTFAVPDLRGEFLRGTGTNSHTNQGSGASVGVHQDATEHNNIFGDGVSSLCVPCTDSDTTDNRKNGNNKKSDSIFTAYDTPKLKYIGINSVTSASLSSHYTSRPTNTSVLYCIKYI